MKISETVAKILLNLKAVSLNPKKPFKYSSGMLSPIYTDCRIVLSFPKERRIIRDLYIDAIKNSGIKFDVIAGTATAGIPHAAWIAEKLNLPMVYVRGKAKDHGKGNQIEGIVKKGQNVAVVEDLISTGESSIETATAIKKAGAKASIIFSIMTYGMSKSKENFKENNLKLVSLTNFEDLLQTAEKLGYIDSKDKEIAKEWINDPPSWGKKMGFE